ncbi:NADPH-dependent 1-acyldihydroxyacetone phosphate reductase [Penicillium alfredii]|uniref:NADPH-dependent 1-acyldihydroxyacetone phosphate reductase n=1 Tax=Penicillium alfredii TaxID=1506179 RepID=A0A9W9K499_9EURO|nr:NADPH-dependent 1-acyldihydroxyacetone phosphate reductase [Penicillium alfredii]KAJ5092593.1 NADPH-dependent 1-acyldihydroxyacetone phosphate reductase [Penicillium alfredii]
MSSTRSVLITGCSDGGLGAALHEAGLHVYATARNPSKMTGLAARGIKTLALDVLDETSIADCVSKLPSLDILINNAGGGHSMPVTDLSIPEAKKTFDLNVWSYIAVTQAFLPLLLKSPKAMVVNQTSIASLAAIPFQSVYNASKAAMAMISDSLRLELQPFGIHVVDLRTGVVRSNLVSNIASAQPVLPKGSIYEPAREEVEKALRQEEFADAGWPASQWAEQVTRDLLKTNPPLLVWKGESVCLMRLASLLPAGALDGTVMKVTNLDAVSQKVKAKNA